MKRGQILVILSAAFLAGCSTVTQIPNDAIAQTKRIGVVSQMGSTLPRQYVGATVFGNERDTIDISAWDLDGVYEKQLAAAVTATWGVEAVTLEAQRGDFVQVNDLKGPYSAPIFWGPNVDKIADATRRTCQAKGLDAIVVAARWTSEDLISGTSQVLEGVGVFARRNFVAAHVFSKLVYMDCRSGKALSVARVLNAPTEARGRFKERLPVTIIDPDPEHKTLILPNEKEMRVMRDVVFALPKAAWGATLGSMIDANR